MCSILKVALKVCYDMKYAKFSVFLFETNVQNNDLFDINPSYVKDT